MSNASNYLPIFLGLAAVLAAAPAGAQEANYRLGLQGHYTAPSGTTFYDADGGKMFDGFLSGGFGVSATMEWGLTGNSSIRTRADYLTFGDKNKKQEDYIEGLHSLVSMNYDVTLMGLAADYIYSFESLDTGLYVFGGAGYYSANSGGNVYSMVAMPLPGDLDFLFEGDEAMDGSGTSLGLSFGAGYRFAGNMACELRYTTLSDLKQTVKYGSREESQKMDLSWLQVSLCFRF